MTTAEEIKAYCSALYEPDDVIEIRRLPSGRKSWHLAGELFEQVASLAADNNAGQNIHNGVNPRTHEGGSKATDVVLARCLWADFDDTTPRAALAKCRDVGMPTPTLVDNSGHGCHCYWRLEDELPAAEWSQCQKALARLLSSDSSVNDPARLTRLPGFQNHKKEVAAQCTIIEIHPEIVIKLDDLNNLIERMPVMATTAPSERATVAEDIEGATAFLAKRPGAIEGNNGDDYTYITACEMRDFGLSVENTLALMTGWNLKCVPPWSETELRTKVENAHRHAQNEHGIRLRLACGDWPEVIPLGVHNVPEFPLEAIPDQLGVLRTFCEAAAESYQVPADAVALLILAVGGAALAKRIEVEVKGDWFEPLNLFVVIAMASGERKSSIFRVVMEPMMLFERAENERLAPLIEQSRNERAVLDAELKQAHKDVARANTPEKKLAEKVKMDEIAEQLRTTEVLVELQLVADDATPEVISKILQDQGGRLALMSPEADVFDMMAGRYSDGKGRLGVYLMGHAGDDIRVNRVGRQNEYVHHPALTVALTVQPDALQGLLGKPQLRGRGLLARFLYSTPTSRVGYRSLDPDPIPERVKLAYGRLIRSALGLEPVSDANGGSGPHILRLSDDARVELNKFREKVEHELRISGELGDLRDWGSKLPGAVCRMAAIFHGLIHAEKNALASKPIDGEVMLGAIAIGDYAIEHAKAAFALMGSDSQTVLALRVLAWLRDQGIEKFTKRGAQQPLRATVRADDMDEPLRLLARHGYIREQPKEEKKPGRPSSVFDVNPKWHAQNDQYSS